MAKKRPLTIAKARRTKQMTPIIYVNIGNPTIPRFAKAEIRIKSGKYQYLQWREGGTIRSFYLGRKRDS